MDLENRVLNEVFSKTHKNDLKAVLSFIDPSLFETKKALENKHFRMVLRNLNGLIYDVDMKKLIIYYVKTYLEPEVEKKLEFLVREYNKKAREPINLQHYEFDRNIILEDQCKDFDNVDIRDIASGQHYINRQEAERTGDRRISNRNTIKSSISTIKRIYLQKLNNLRKHIPGLFTYASLSSEQRKIFTDILIRHLVRRGTEPGRILRNVYQSIYLALDEETQQDAIYIYTTVGVRQLKKFIRTNWYSLVNPVIIENDANEFLFSRFIDKDEIADRLYLSLSTIRSLAKRREIKAFKKSRHMSQKSYVYLYPSKSFHEFRRIFSYNVKNKKLFFIAKDLEYLSEKLSEKTYKISEVAEKENYPSETTLRKYMKAESKPHLISYNALISGYGRIKVILESDLEKFMYEYNGLFNNFSITN